jgi:hypothetical protein
MIPEENKLLKRAFIAGLDASFNLPPNMKFKDMEDIQLVIEESFQDFVKSIDKETEQQIADKDSPFLCTNISHEDLELHRHSVFSDNPEDSNFNSVVVSPCIVGEPLPKLGSMYKDDGKDGVL